MSHLKASCVYIPLNATSQEILDKYDSSTLRPNPSIDLVARKGGWNTKD